MINKQVKSSERERESNNYTRATTIDLKTIDSEVALLSGRATQTPIGMKELWDEVQNLKATAKSWEIVTLNKSGGTYGTTYPFDSKYASWNFIVVTGKLYNNYTRSSNSSASVTVNTNYNNISANTGGNMSYGFSFSYTKSGNSIQMNGYKSYSETPNTITVLFYK